MTDAEIEQRVTEIMDNMDGFTKLCLANLNATAIVRDATRVGYCAGAADALKNIMIPGLKALED